MQTIKQLSPHFTFSELSYTARKDFAQQNTALASNYITELSLLANYILEPARAILGVPLIITSGYRCKALNRVLGGVGNSQHLYGQAADFIPQNIPLEQAFSLLKNAAVLNFGQLIYEGDWLHISLGAPFREFSKCRQVLELL